MNNQYSIMHRSAFHARKLRAIAAITMVVAIAACSDAPTQSVGRKLVPVSKDVDTLGALLFDDAGIFELKILPLRISTRTTVTVRSAENVLHDPQIIESTAILIQPDSVSFGGTLKMTYDPAELPADARADSLKIYRLYGLGWAALPSAVNVSTHSLLTTIGRGGVYAVGR